MVVALPHSSAGVFPPTRGEAHPPRIEDSAECGHLHHQHGWTEMQDELLAKLLEAAGRQEGGLGSLRPQPRCRLVCDGWKAVHDALVRPLVLRRQTTDEAMSMLVRSFPRWSRSR